MTRYLFFHFCYGKYQIWSWFKPYKGGMNRTNLTNCDARQGQGTEVKGVVKLSLASP